MLTRRPHLSLVLVLAVGAACVADLGAGAEAARDLLRASAPGAYSVRYLPDRAVISAGTQQETELRVYIPREPLWGYVDGARQPGSFFTWDPEASAVGITLSAGQHAFQVGWAGTGEQPRQGQTIPVLVDGRRVGDLTARFTLDAMTAEGAVDLGPARARVWLDTDLDAGAIDAVASLGATRVDTWRPLRGRLAGRHQVLLGGDGLMRLTVKGYNLLRSPVSAVEIERISPAAEVVRVDSMPTEGIIIEAEDFVREGGGSVQISEGGHYDQHGGKSIFGFTGDGHWLEWEFEVPADGLYDLYARVATAEEMSFREIRVNRRLPGSGYALVQFAGTGGWARGPGEWGAMHVAGTSDDLPPLALKAGRNTLRLKGVMPYHMNVDYFVLCRRR